MIEVFFVLTTILFGASIIFAVKQSMWIFFLHMTLSWLIGSMVTGFLTTILSHFILFSYNLLYLVMFLQVFISFIAVYHVYHHHKTRFRKRIEISFEKSPGLFLVLIIAGLMAKHLSSVFYLNYPNYIQKSASNELELEQSVIISNIEGCNVFHPNIFALEDPFLHNSLLKKSPLVYEFSSLLLLASGHYEDVSLIISFFNSIATAYAMFIFAGEYTSYRLVSVLLFLFNSGWSFVLYFINPPSSSDLVHDIGKPYNSPFYQIFFKFLIASKDSSFSVPIAIFALTLMFPQKTIKGYNRILVITGILAALCPSNMASILLFILSTCSFNTLKTVFPFALILLLKYQTLSISFFPLWKEYQMHGVSFPRLRCFVDLLGPIILILPMFPFFLRNIHLFYRLCITICPLVFCMFMRSGGYYEDNAVAFSSIIFPIYLVSAVYVFEMIILKTKGKAKGYILGIGFIIFSSMIFGALLSIKRSFGEITVGVTQSSFELANFVRNNIKNNEVFFIPNMFLNPITFNTGRRIILGNQIDLWRRGEDYLPVLESVRLLTNEKSIKKLMLTCRSKYFLSLNKDKLEKMTDFDEIYKNEDWILFRMKE